MKHWRTRLGVMATTLALVCVDGVALAQQGKVEPPLNTGRGGGGVGFGLQVDLGALWSATRAASPADEPAEDLPGHIVGVWALDTLLDPATVAAAAQGELLASHALSNLGLQVALLRVPTTQTQTSLQTLQQRYPEATFGPQRLYAPLMSNPNAANAVQYAAALLHAPQPAPALPAPVRIGIVDGVPDPSIGLEASAIALLPMVPSPSGTQHATAVACILACAPSTGWTGLARGTSLVFAAVLRQDHAGRPRSDTYTVARALDALLGRRVDVINMSLGGAPDAVLQRVIERVLPRVRGLVSAAGNSGPQGPKPYPATHPGVIAVAAVDATAEPWPQGTRGPHVAIAAPGVDLWLPLDGGRYFSGTSYAAPFVTAALATRIAFGQAATIEALCNSATDLPPTGRDEATGCGLLQWPSTDDASGTSGHSLHPPIEKSAHH